MNREMQFKINAPHIVHEIFEDHEAAIINLKTGNYYSLDPVGAFIWGRVEHGASAGEILDEVLEHYQGDAADITRELIRFFEALQAEDHEAAIINLKTGNYYSLDPVGAFIWGRVEHGASAGEILDEVLEHYEGDAADITRELIRFFEALQAEELIMPLTDPAPRSDAQGGSNGASGNGGKIPFSAPIVERYNDMQELLLLDPIHEVDDTGWPNRKRED